MKSIDRENKILLTKNYRLEQRKKSLENTIRNHSAKRESLINKNSSLKQSQRRNTSYVSTDFRSGSNMSMQNDHNKARLITDNTISEIRYSTLVKNPPSD